MITYSNHQTVSNHFNFTLKRKGRILSDHPWGGTIGTRHIPALKRLGLAQTIVVSTMITIRRLSSQLSLKYEEPCIKIKFNNKGKVREPVTKYGSKVRHIRLWVANENLKIVTLLSGILSVGYFYTSLILNYLRFFFFSLCYPAPG